jgi:pre-rRNA-processing protein IPI3
MLTENFIAATHTTSTKPNVSSTLKDVGIALHEFRPQTTFRHGLKKSSTKVNCVAIGDTHIFAVQADKAVVHVYSREKGNQESTVAFPERIHSIAFVGESNGFVILGTEGGRLTVWEVASGRQSSSTASHLQPVSRLSVLPGNNLILSGSPDSNVQVWSLPQLVSFSQPHSVFLGDEPSNGPLRTFSSHRSGITALSCGHSMPLSNFAVSASADATCYIWSPSDGQILRSILFPSAPQCLAIDPANRALYAGHEDGSIQSLDFYADSAVTQNIHSAGSSQLVQISTKDKWTPVSSEVGSAQCLTLSYDGMTLLSGHASGKIVSWDVAKCRVQKVIAELGHSVTTISMQRPEGLPHNPPHIQVKTVVKPKIEQPSPDQLGTCTVPEDYTLKVQITPSRQSQCLASDPPSRTDFESILSSQVFPQDLIDAAILGLELAESPTAQTHPSQSNRTYIPLSETDISTTTSSNSHITKLESRISVLEENLAIYVSAAERSRARRLDRMQRRSAFGQRKREAYSAHLAAAAKAVRDVEAKMAMREWEEREREVDEESDDVEMGEEVYADV